VKKYDTEKVCKNCGNTYGDHRSCDDACLDMDNSTGFERTIFGVIETYKELGTMFEPKRKKVKS
jgi:hypothetical protein